MNVHFLHIPQHKEFPEKFLCVITGEPCIAAIPIYKFDLEAYCLFTKSENVITKFYSGIAPQTYEEDGYPALVFLFSRRRLPLFGVVEAVPRLYVKFALERVYNVVVSTLSDEDIVQINKSYIKNTILNLFNVDPEGVIVESEYKAKAFLIHANKQYHSHYIIRRKS